MRAEEPQTAGALALKLEQKSNVYFFPTPQPTAPPAPIASTSTFGELGEFDGLWGIAEEIVWRPKLFEKNPKYPKVTAPGHYFQDHSGGWTLTRRSDGGYAGHYTNQAIADLESKYGSKSKKKQRAKRAPKRDLSGRRATGRTGSDPS